jgi:uncharacterized integral membrane protein
MSSRPPLDEPAREPARPTRKKPDRTVESKTLAALVLAGLLVVFAVANSQKVEVDFLVATSNIPLVLIILIAILLGAVLGAITHWRSHRRIGK